jgi:acyl carrier protein
VTGKLDRRALPAPGADAYSSREYEAPQGEIEQALAALWQSVLRIDRVGREDNFFELGGHSLSAMQLLARIHAAFHLEVPMRMLFDSPTLRQLAGRVEALRLASLLERLDDEDAQTREVLARVAAMSEHEVRELLHELTMEERP